MEHCRIKISKNQKMAWGQEDNLEHKSDCRRDYSQGIAIGHSIGYGKKETVHSRDFLEAILYKDNFNRAYKSIIYDKTGEKISPGKRIPGMVQWRMYP